MKINIFITLCILTLDKISMKDKIKIVIGYVLISFFPKKADDLAKKRLTINPLLTVSERLMRIAILHTAESNNNIDDLSNLHKYYWTNQGKGFFFQNKDSFTNYLLPNCAFVFDIVKEKLSKNEVDIIVEIGTGNGDLLHYVEKKFTKKISSLDLT